MANLAPRYDPFLDGVPILTTRVDFGVGDLEATTSVHVHEVICAKGTKVNTHGP